ncbi:hypothetical protein AC249_AIPGENE6290 [Exaiptasia diaphana]|nr:hypothetical protein AC249_AIPGENE6290 [Exaiptasia diaphana]
MNSDDEEEGKSCYGLDPELQNIQLCSFETFEEDLANSPKLHCTSTTTVLETVIILLDWFSSHSSLSKEAFAKIVPAQCSGLEPKTLDPYHEVVIDEIMSMASFKIFDAYQKAPFNVKVEVLLYVRDYPGIGKVFPMTACGSYVYCSHLHKMIYYGNRRFVPKESPLRQDIKNFLEKCKETRMPPDKRTFSQAPKSRTFQDCTNPVSVDHMFHNAFGRAESTAQKTRIASETGCLASKYPSFDQVTQSVQDAMHTIAVQVKHLLRCLSGKSPEDGVAVGNVEKDLGRFPAAWQVSSTDGKETSPQPSFGLRKKEMEEAERRAMEVIVPKKDPFNAGPIFSKISRLNSFELKEQSKHSIGQLKNNVQETLSIFERDFPVSIQKLHKIALIKQYKTLTDSAEKLQQAMEIMFKLFQRYGLQMSLVKTRTMIMTDSVSQSNDDDENDDDDDNDDEVEEQSQDMAYKLTNEQVHEYTKATPMKNFVENQQLKWFAHIGETNASKTFPQDGPFGTKPDFSGFNVHKWEKRTNALHRIHAERARATKKQKQKNRKIIYDTGARYTALLELPYYDANCFVVVDQMHNLFLGIAKTTMKIWKDTGALNDKDLEIIQKSVNAVEPLF